VSPRGDRNVIVDFVQSRKKAPLTVPDAIENLLVGRPIRMKRFIATYSAIIIMTLCSIISAKADSVTFSLGNNPQADEENILLNNGMTGPAVLGLTNQTQLQVRFSSTTDSLNIPSGGQARVEAQDGLVNNITISVPGGTFHDLIINPFFGSGVADVSVVTAGNQTFAFSYTLGVGQNFLTIVGDPGTSIVSVTINAAGGFTDLRQPRISGAGVTVPEPTTMFLLGLGLLGTAGVVIRRNIRKRC
jgi:PEP-CTERM motif